MFKNGKEVFSMAKNTNKKINENGKTTIAIEAYATRYKLENIKAIDSFGNEVIIANNGGYTVYGVNDADRDFLLKKITEKPANLINAKIMEHVRNVYDYAMLYNPCTIVTAAPNLIDYGDASIIDEIRDDITVTALRMAEGKIESDEGTTLIKKHKEKLDAAKENLKIYNEDKSSYRIAKNIESGMRNKYENDVVAICNDIYRSVSSTGNHYDFHDVILKIRNFFKPEIALPIVEEMHKLRAELDAYKRIDDLGNKVADASLMGAQATLGVAGSLAIGYKMIKGGISLAKKISKLNQLLK